MKRPWILPLLWFSYSAVVATGTCGLVYAAVQQDLRQSANDPQIQIAEDAGAQLTAGRAIENVVPAQKIDIATSLAPYMIIYNSAGTPVLSSGLLNSAMPNLPSGVFSIQNTYNKTTTPFGVESRFTWQPRSGVRSALVLLQITTPGGIEYVAIGRSLREVENRESALLKLVFLVWLTILVGLLAVTYVAQWLLKNKY